uniref:Gluconokinase n=1 Tax=Trieres chinensis TaxID=1514140 RepID=A0A7S2EV33_TRICV|mmetsp:Transcript_3909/g.8310  ORF Transcript_3909/g.8310 Transcript_3909/m.8310 type:complete len:233 (+) Transcript_3909:37-735(+)|eukprot:CAMPEP_0183293238 /NCGR_PEP_ID=MMETSP0160_2-20130417/2002_1 /TAXON_ID=2839 ORGANISM="Odontella Sinensis, Strain Grunow 1884" /NCGR_SAMPLE_ID=MMETSP0160_2 /ASSEMBLY_ACC=CAM_ASM_000250 /LENGTH=232 /DNA_ID=CAMNT_0025454325 /DNA_START=33 /DNA_END=731 /DNA_ORIENTATION=+
MLLWVSGQSGAGKTTLGQNLAEHHGFCHFDGDIYYSGGDPLEDSGKFIGSGKATDELKSQWQKIVSNYESLFDGREIPLEDWKDALGGLCMSVAKAAQKHPKLVVTFSIYSLAVRIFVRDRITEICSAQDPDAAVDFQFLVLNDVDGAAAKRKLEQVKQAAEAQGKTMEEFVAQYGKEYKGEEHTLNELLRSQRGFEPGVEDNGEIAISVTEKENCQKVLEMAAQRLGLTSV